MSYRNNIPVGRSSFADIRENGYYFIDKSGLIEELLKTDGTQVTLITRPRRFGKTLGMSMLSEFFDIRKDSGALFAGLRIMERQELCLRWMNQYPTLFLTLKDVSGNTFDSALGMLQSVIANLCVEHAYLGNSEKVDEAYKEKFLQLKLEKANDTALKNSIALLMRMMRAHYGRPVILLLDEYDVPVAKAGGNHIGKENYYSKMMEVIRALISTAVKDNDSLKFAVITGCLKITKESIFTGTNNFTSDTISDTRLNEYFGFTQKEVDQLLRDTGLTDHREELKEWYDGYRFGAFDIYCPWDVMNHVKNLLLNPAIKPAGYWKNSSDNGIIRSFIDHTSSTITQKFEKLLSGGCVVQKIETDLTYDYLYSSEKNLWSVLYLTGYLTRARGEEMEKDIPEGCLPLVIPNAEIKEIFESTIKAWFEEATRDWDRKALFSAVWSGCEETVTAEMTKLLRKTISYHDYGEDFYHAFFAGIFAGAGYVVESNKEYGEGRSDIVVKDYAGDRAAVFEVKYSRSQNALLKDCQRAVSQIDQRMYGRELGDDYSEVICYGISFYKKRCLVQRQKLPKSPCHPASFPV